MWFRGLHAHDATVFDVWGINKTGTASGVPAGTCPVVGRILRHEPDDDADQLPFTFLFKWDSGHRYTPKGVCTVRPGIIRDETSHCPGRVPACPDSIVRFLL